MGKTGRKDGDDKGRHICVGLFAHVDAGKTTLAESILYLSGSIRKAGRVDHGDSFLDNYELERSRGITIFSKQAELELGDWSVTLLDTPGHVDFSAEMERCLQVLDYAVLVISGPDGVQGHTETLWRLLKRYRIPTFLFINKMDQEGTDTGQILRELQERLDEGCLDFCGGAASEGEWLPTMGEELLENIAMCREDLLETYLESGAVEPEAIRELIAGREIFPCYFGSALRGEGGAKFLQGMSLYMKEAPRRESFGAKVYKITRDDKRARLTHLKLTGGALKVKEQLSYKDEAGESRQEKVDQIRVYSGEKYELRQEAKAGEICAVTGLTGTYPGQGLGEEKDSKLPLLEPVLSYQIISREEDDVHRLLQCLKELEEEEPLLHVSWNETLQELHAQIMGEIQTEILQKLIEDRFGFCVQFGQGSIVYKETIRNTVEGVGHFEPLRHYAEVHLLLEPQETGSGLQFASALGEDELDRNWQRLILTHLEEKEHKGVLSGSAITDMKITLVAGKAHLKHTEGGDFRQACYRAVRQGLMKAESVLLEPFYRFRLELPAEQLGRAMADIQRMSGSFEEPENQGELAVLSGSAPVSELQNYQSKISAYTGGRGRISCSLQGYYPCHNAEVVLGNIHYDPEQDTENTADSVFCAHGAGYVVKWDQVEEHMHLESVLKKEKTAETTENGGEIQRPNRRITPVTELSWEEEQELQKLIEEAYRPRERQRRFSYGKAKMREEQDRMATVSKKSSRGNSAEEERAGKAQAKKEQAQKEYLLVDGYNIIFAWEDLKELAAVNLDAARDKLQDILSNYQGYQGCTLILVFDAYKLEGFEGEAQKYHNIYVVYTKEAETADQYIEKTAHEIGRKHQVTVATSDGTEQVIIRGAGCRLLSARELREEIARVERLIREERRNRFPKGERNYLFDYLDEEMAGEMEELRLGKVQTEKEFLDVLNPDGTLSGRKCERDIVHREGLFHRTVDIWLVRKRTDGGYDILLQKRAAQKKAYPGYYDTSAAGHVRAGDYYLLSAQRELEEELGVHAAKEELLPVGVHEAFWHDSFRGEPFHNHELSRIYLLDRSVEIGELRLQEEEVESVCWANLDECLQKLREGKWKSCLNLERLEMLKTFLRGK